MSKTKRGMLAAALTAAIAGLPATPSLASAQTVELGIFFNDVIVGADSNGTTERAVLIASDRAELHDRVLTVDFTALTGKITVASESHSGTCNTTATKMTCTEHIPTILYPGPTGILPEIRFKPVPGVPAGTSGEIKVTVSAKETPAVSTTATVTIGEGVDLASGPSVEVDSTPGGTFAPHLEIGNIGETTAHGAVALFFGDYGFNVSKQHSNCHYRDGQVTFCKFSEDLLADTDYRTSEGVPLNLRKDTEAPSFQWLEISWVTPAEFEIIKDEIAQWNPGWFGNPGTGSKLELVKAPSADSAQVDLDPTNNWMDVTVNVSGDNPADLAALGGSGSGGVGTVVALDLGLKNLGPATIDHGRSGEVTSQVTIQLPPGSSLAEMPEDCVALGDNGQPDFDDPDNLAARGIACWPIGSLFIAGTQATFPVKLRIDQAVANATGKVMVVSPFCEENCKPNYNESNNNADVILNATVSLPVTGAQAGLLAGAGTLLLIAGVALFMLTRRRRFNLRES